MNNTSEGNGEFILDPVTVHLVVNQQMLCFPFTSTGYPDVEYEMYYKVSEEGDYLPVTANQSCLVQSGDVSNNVCVCVHVCVYVCVCVCVFVFVRVCVRGCWVP